MIKIFRLFMVGTIVFMLLASVATAQKDTTLRESYATWSGYWTKTPADSTIRPGTGGNWSISFPAVKVKKDSIIYLGAQNEQINFWTKSCTLHVEGANLNKLAILNQAGYKEDGGTARLAEVTSTSSNTHRLFTMYIEPQPHFEWFKLKDTAAAAADSVTIDTAYFHTYCAPGPPLPGLTNWGLIILLALLLLSGIIVIRQRRRGVVRA